MFQVSSSHFEGGAKLDPCDPPREKPKYFSWCELAADALSGPAKLFPTMWETEGVGIPRRQTQRETRPWQPGGAVSEAEVTAVRGGWHGQADLGGIR